jgi:PleD family two-component response regulator
MRVTISAGIATLEPNETPDTILARADSALYAAKAGGRNRIASA